MLERGVVRQMQYSCKKFAKSLKNIIEKLKVVFLWALKLLIVLSNFDVLVFYFALLYFIFIL